MINVKKLKELRNDINCFLTNFQISPDDDRDEDYVSDRRWLAEFYIEIKKIKNELDIIIQEKQIKIGDYLQMGTYYNKPILWRCVDINENGPLMLSDKILCLKPFDASGYNKKGSHKRGFNNGSDRRRYGSNYWADSNIRCWLNSNASAGNVVWACGNPPDSSYVWDNAYDNEAGFLTNFSSSELACIKTVTQDSLLDRYEYSNMSPYGSTYHSFNYIISNVVQNAKTTAYRESVTDSMFLLDVNQINKVYQNDSKLGGNNYYIGIPTDEAVKNSEYKNENLNATTGWWSWLRSPGADYYSDFVRSVDSDGDVYSDGAYNGDGGVRPAFYLNLSNFDSIGKGTKSDPYKIKKKLNKIKAFVKIQLNSI